MWVRTNEGDLVNVDHMEWIVIEQDEVGDDDEDGDGEEGYQDAGDEPDREVGSETGGPGDHELRAYQLGWDPDDEGGSSYYTLSSSPQRGVVEEHLAMIRAAISKGDHLVEMPAPAAGWTG